MSLVHLHGFDDYVPFYSGGGGAAEGGTTPYHSGGGRDPDADPKANPNTNPAPSASTTPAVPKAIAKGFPWWIVLLVAGGGVAYAITRRKATKTKGRRQ